jgi:hypothetical protein
VFEPDEVGGCNIGRNQLTIVERFHIKFLFLAPAALACLTAFLVFAVTSSSWANTWRGTAPFCNGQCQPGEPQLATSNCGDGACCWTGHKALCGNPTPMCASLQTRTKCFGVVLVCDNGHYEAASQWVSCSQYVCGACLGFSL